MPRRSRAGQDAVFEIERAVRQDVALVAAKRRTLNGGTRSGPGSRRPGRAAVPPSAHWPESSTWSGRRSRGNPTPARRLPRPFRPACCGRRTPWCGCERPRACRPAQPAGAARHFRRPRSRPAPREVRGNQRQPERREDRLLVRPRGRFVPARLVPGRALAGGRDEAPFAQAQAPVQGALAHLDVVVLRAREVVERERELLGRDDPEVGLESALEADARLGPAARRHLADAGHAREPGDDGLDVAGRDDEVQVPDGLEPAAKAAGRLGAAHLGQRAEPGQDRGRRLARVPPEVPLRVRLPGCGCRSGSSPGSSRQIPRAPRPARPCRPPASDAMEVTFSSRAQGRDLLRSEARDLEHLDQPRLDGGLQLAPETPGGPWNAARRSSAASASRCP